MWLHHVINDDGGVSVNVWTYTKSIKDAWKGIYETVIKVPNQLLLVEKIQLVKEFVSILLPKLGKDTTFVTRHFHQRYQQMWNKAKEANQTALTEECSAPPVPLPILPSNLEQLATVVVKKLQDVIPFNLGDTF